jgi:hypothetical protein
MVTACGQCHVGPQAAWETTKDSRYQDVQCESCHGDANAARSALLTRLSRVSDRADTLMAMLTRIDPNLDGAGGPIDPNDNTLSVAEGAFFNYKLANWTARFRRAVPQGPPASSFRPLSAGREHLEGVKFDEGDLQRPEDAPAHRGRQAPPGTEAGGLDSDDHEPVGELSQDLPQRDDLPESQAVAGRVGRGDGEDVAKSVQPVHGPRRGPRTHGVDDHGQRCARPQVEEIGLPARERRHPNVGRRQEGQEADRLEAGSVVAPIRRPESDDERAPRARPGHAHGSPISSRRKWVAHEMHGS